MHTPLGHEKLPLPALDKLDSCEQTVHDEPWSTCLPDYQPLLLELRRENGRLLPVLTKKRMYLYGFLTLKGSGHCNPAIYILLEKLHSKQAPQSSEISTPRYYRPKH